MEGIWSSQFQNLKSGRPHDSEQWSWQGFRLAPSQRPNCTQTQPFAINRYRLLSLLADSRTRAESTAQDAQIVAKAPAKPLASSSQQGLKQSLNGQQLKANILGGGGGGGWVQKCREPCGGERRTNEWFSSGSDKQTPIDTAASPVRQLETVLGHIQLTGVVDGRPAIDKAASLASSGPTHY